MSASVKIGGVLADFVFDTFALIGFIRQETGAQRVYELLQQAERGEIACIVDRKISYAAAPDLLASRRRASVIIDDASWQRIVAAAHMKAQHSMSYADAFAASLARDYGATLLAGDSEFEAVAGEISIERLNC